MKRMRINSSTTFVQIVDLDEWYFYTYKYKDDKMKFSLLITLLDCLLFFYYSTYAVNLRIPMAYDIGY